MEARIFDVEHGFCALVLTDNFRWILVDCGHNSSTGFRPSLYLQQMRVNFIDLFVVTNYDEDHLSDLPNIISSGIKIGQITYNSGISVNQLRNLKLQNGPLGPGISMLIKLFNGFTYFNTPPTLIDGVLFSHYCNNYSQFQDTNNLSLVTFLDYKNAHLVFPGDIETAGWKLLLNSSDFLEKLKDVKIFTASHHGRESGYCREVFDYCKPDIIIVSDGHIMYDTQRGLYRYHSNGVQFPGNEKRYVLTTRRDGMITITHQYGSEVYVDYSKR